MGIGSTSGPAGNHLADFITKGGKAVRVMRRLAGYPLDTASGRINCVGPVAGRASAMNRAVSPPCC